MLKVNIEKEYADSKRSSNNVFYHYTSTDSLINIIKNKTIRLTDCEFLNDKEEYHYIEELIENTSLYNDPRVIEFLNYNKGMLSKNNDEIIQSSRKDKYEIFHASYYVLSGTTNSDSLPMWNYYVKDGNYYGYSIGFDSNKLYNNMKNIDGYFYYGKVIYDREKQIQIIEEKIKDLINEAIDLDANSIEDMVIDFYYNFIQRIRLFFKNPGFKHEDEYRIVMCIDKDKVNNYGFISKNGLIKPYIECSISEINPIKSIIMSPSIEKEIGEKGIKKILEFSKLDKEKIEILHSNIKVRY